ncbi:flocculation protein FLO11 [Notolabrus celidotus]|uniref:flocculation protein FLO11 n=1 Tax=Notolabrus celidotus TaxID=1203425 RepID=UPI00148F6735|nr:flocculation protein FLO11 [Notolabrus celidotus]
MATGRSSLQPAEGEISVKAEAEHRGEEDELRWRGINRNHAESYKPFTSTSWKPEQHSVNRAGERRSQTVEGLDHRSCLPPQTLPLKNSSSSSSGDLNPSRHVLHPPVPCRPQPIKSSPVSLPWPLSESTDWVSAPGSSLVIPPSPKSHPLRFPSIIQTGQQGRKPVFGSMWYKQGAVKPATKEPTVLFRLRSLTDHAESPTKPQERKDIQTQRTERGSADGHREACDGPLDLSKSIQTTTDYSPLTSRGGERIHSSPDGEVNLSAQRPETSPAPSSSPSSSSPAKLHEKEPSPDHNHTQEVSKQRGQLNGCTEQNNTKKVPVLTLSLRPVVVLENLNSALQKQDSPSNSKSSSPAAETGSSSDGQEEEGSVSGTESNRSCKRKRMETDRDSETDNVQPERKIQLTVRSEEKSPR